MTVLSEELPATTEKQRPLSGAAATELALRLGVGLSPVGLVFSRADLSYDEWENLGRAVGFIGNAWQWWVGDWLNVGEMLFGQDSANAVDDVKQTRMDLAQRITGKDPGTIANIASICNRVSKEVRRQELDFTHHAKVSPLDPEEQRHWLQLAIDNEWSTSDLAAAIKEAKQGTPEIEEESDPSPGPGGVSLSERLDEIANAIYRASQPTSHGTAEYPIELLSQLGTVLGYAN
jgi:hypothetical protein